MGSVLSAEEFGELFHKVRHSARHLENRDCYDMPEEREPFRRYLAGQLSDVDERLERIGWQRVVRRLVEAGGRFDRVRVVPEHLTDYLRFELFGCRLNVEFGEDVRYLARERASQLELPDHDYWVLDRSTLVLMRFTADDRPLAHELVSDPELVARHEQWMDVAMTNATPYAEYLAQDPSRELPSTGAD